MNRHYEPIPIPFKQRLRELRVRVLPILVFLGVGIIVFQLWTDNVSSPGLIGEVVADYSTVASPGDGVLINFYYDRFDRIDQGQLIGQVMQKDSLILNAQLNEVLAEIELIEHSLEPGSGGQRSAINFEELKIEEIQIRIDFARITLQRERTKAEYNRVAELHARELVSDQEYEMIRTELNLLTVQADEKRELIEYLAGRLEELETIGRYGALADRDPLLAAIKVQEQRMETILAESAPVPIYAPISGVISEVLHKQGEYVTTGNQIMQIESNEPAYIVGYVRQPITIEPYTGMQVEVRTRKPGRNFFVSTIEQVGGHIRLIDDQLQRPGAIFESGLPVKISVNHIDDNRLYPGEMVDIVLRQ
jgi:multidrug resistance efflux pump